MKTFIFTCGDINGIGPEIIIKTLNRITKNSDNRFIVIIPVNVFEEVCSLIKPEFHFYVSKTGKTFSEDQVNILQIKKASVKTGVPTAQSGKTSFEAIKNSFNLLRKNKADAVITAPISKYSLNLAGIKYPGHTEMYAEWCRVRNYVMMFLSDQIKAGLYSIHIPLSKVPGMIKKKKLESVLRILISALKNDLGINHPKIGVLGLNPHAGENGLLGKEEKTIITPVIEKITEAEGPFSPDAFFAVKMYKRFDAVLGMYHDQVLIPFKLLNFSTGVNYTAGLPIIRTSPDHGTAFDIAGKGMADESSMAEAYYYAALIAGNRKS